MLPAPFSSISPQHSPRVKEREVWPGVSKSRSMSDREQGNKKYGLKTHSSLTITVKPAPSHVPYSVKDNSLNIGDISYTRRNLSRRSSSSAADYSHSRRNWWCRYPVSQSVLVVSFVSLHNEKETDMNIQSEFSHIFSLVMPDNVPLDYCSLWHTFIHIFMYIDIYKYLCWRMCSVNIVWFFLCFVYTVFCLNFSRSI